MSKTPFIDFRAIKSAITMEQVLIHYGLLDRFKQSGDSLSGPCPIHKGENPTQFRISITKNIWNCFSECKHGGNTLDFISLMDKISIHAAALKAIEWFHLDTALNPTEDEGEAKPRGSYTQTKTANVSKVATKKVVAEPDKNDPNKPLKFRLDKLERDHPYLAERGLNSETINDFGIGYCAKGMMADRIAIPILNTDGNVVAYVGRSIGEPKGDSAKYKLPQGFRKSLELFNIDRALKEPIEKPLGIVEGFFDCMKLHQHGCRKVVALMGSSLSLMQEELIRRYSDRFRFIVILLDENEAGRAGREDIAVRLANFAFVKIHVFDKEGREPEHLSAEEANLILG